jgi:hypothetical protein
MKLGISAAALIAAAALAQPASALTINLHDIGGVTGSRAEYGFRAAANFWQSVITNDVTLNFDVGFEDLGPNILGGTSSSIDVKAIVNVENRIRAFGSDSAVDTQVASATGLPALGASEIGPGTGVTVVTPGYADPVAQTGVDTSTAVLDADGSFNNYAMGISTANAKAIGYDYSAIPDLSDATIEFSSTFAFDFTPGNGIGQFKYDFIAVAIHEMGHALGFLSGGDDYDYIGCPNGPACGDYDTYPVNDTWWGYTLDLFRYSTDYDGQARLDWRPGVDAYFSLDQGATNFANFSTGSFNGNGDQASHWLAPQSSPFCRNFVGVMNPYLCNRTNGIVTANDIAAFDAIGWNFTEAARAGDFSFNTNSLAVPEASTWAMLILGLGGMGAVLRRRRAIAVA